MAALLRQFISLHASLSHTQPPPAALAPAQLASFQGGVDSKTSTAAEATPLPSEQMRPAGPVTLAGVRHSYLWLADCLGRPFLLSLRHPGLRLRCLAARGELTTARTIAERGGGVGALWGGAFAEVAMSRSIAS